MHHGHSVLVLQRDSTPGRQIPSRNQKATTESLVAVTSPLPGSALKSSWSYAGPAGRGPAEESEMTTLATAPASRPRTGSPKAPSTSRAVSPRAPPAAPTHVVDPATGEDVYTYELAGAADVDAAVAAARAAFPGWAGATPGERSDAMHRFAAVLRRARRGPRPRRVAAVRQAAQAEPRSSTSRAPSTTPRSSRAPPATCRARPPASTAATTPRTYAASPSASSAPSRPGTTRSRWPPGRSCRPIAAGNTIVLKPAELTPLTSLMFAQAATRGGHPRRRGQHRHRRGPGRRRAPGRPPRRRHDLLHRLDRASASASPRSPPAPSSGCISNSAARRRSSSSTTPTWRPPCTARSPAP